MAAARLGSRSFDELEAAIDHGTHLLQVTHRSPARRHRSLDSLVAWSAALLDVDERRMFAELSVFAGSVSATDAAAVIKAERSGDIVFTLGSLADRSLLVAATDGPSTRYRMLSTVRAVAGRWLDDDADAATDVRRRHALHFATVVRSIDHVIRTPSEIEGRRRLDIVVDEVRAAHSWAQRDEPELAADISGALHLPAYSTFWNEPVEWARSLLARYPAANADELLGARLIVAGSAANSGELGLARAEVVGASRSDDLRTRAAAVEILSDVGLYAGDLDGVAAHTDELRLLGAELADAHWEVIATVNAALALTFADRPHEAISRLAELELLELAPSDRAWLIYAGAEALSALGEPDAPDAYESAIDLARGVGNPFVVSVSQVSLATEHSRAGRHRQALDAFAECLHAYARHGNYVHAVTLLRNMIGVLAVVGDDHGAPVIGAATSSDLLRKSYGPEAERIAKVLESAERRAGPTQFAEWTLEGSGLGVATTVQFANGRIALLAG
jgi:tetratricopeptide (TPR) repeat protein